jgi:hypothetical protein
VDSIISLEWTHSEIAKFSSRQGSHGDRDLLSVLSTTLNVKMRGCGDKSKAAILVDCLWDDNFLDGEVQGCMIDRVHIYLCNHVFTPWQILKAMDLAGLI